MTQKILGYSLLVCGLGIVIFAVSNVYYVFKGITTPYPLFNLAPITIDASRLIPVDSQNRGIVQTPAEITLIRSETLNTLSNLFAYYIFFGFVATIGFRLANLGTTLVRPIIVQTHEPRSQTSHTSVHSDDHPSS